MARQRRSGASPPAIAGVMLGASPSPVSESHSPSAIAEFPLIWRWMSASHALFSESELAGLHPCSPTEAARIYDDSRSFDSRSGLDPKHFSSVRLQPADISIPD